MSCDQNALLPVGKRQRPWGDALQLGPKKKPCLTDPLVHHGRHFGRTTHALCDIRALMHNGVQRMGELVNDPDSSEETREDRVFRTLLQAVPGLEDRLERSSPEEIRIVSDLIQKGSSSARSDDTKSLKSAIIDWITPKGQGLHPPLACNVKTNRGFHHPRTGYLLCPADLDWSDAETKEKLCNGDLSTSGDQWPIFLYHQYSYDHENPWVGLFRSALIVTAYKHIFISPSSADKESKATRLGNARRHGMSCVTPASIAYVATQVRFGLSSSPVFSRADLTTDSERFYTSILDILEDPDEATEVQDLLLWWNRQIFPNHASEQYRPAANSVMSRIKEKRAALKAANIANTMPRVSV